MQLRALFSRLGPVMRNRSRNRYALNKAMPLRNALARIAAVVPAAALVIGSAPSGGVNVTVSGLRNAKGFIRACITPNPKDFPDCGRGGARKVSIAAANGAVLSFPNLPAGRYAISILHDENGDGRMNKMLMLPKEGFGFSRDAPVRLGPPSFGSAAFDVGAGTVNAQIKVRYM